MGRPILKVIHELPEFQLIKFVLICVICGKKQSHEFTNFLFSKIIKKIIRELLRLFAIARVVANKKSLFL